MADSNSSLSSGKRAVPDIVPPSVTNNGCSQMVHAPAPGSLQESPAKGSNSSSKEVVADPKEEAKSLIDFWACESIVFRHLPALPPFTRIYSLSEIKEAERYRDPLFWMKPDDDDDYDWVYAEGVDSD